MHYLLKVKFKIKIDYKSFKYLSIQPNLNRRQCRLMELLQEFDFDMEYVKDEENVVVDALSRRPLTNAILCIKNSLIDEIKTYYANENFFKNPLEILAKEVKIIVEIDRFKSIALKDGVLYYSA